MLLLLLKTCHKPLGKSCGEPELASFLIPPLHQPSHGAPLTPSPSPCGLSQAPSPGFNIRGCVGGGFPRDRRVPPGPRLRKGVRTTGEGVPETPQIVPFFLPPLLSDFFGIFGGIFGNFFFLPVQGVSPHPTLLVQRGVSDPSHPALISNPAAPPCHLARPRAPDPPWPMQG